MPSEWSVKLTEQLVHAKIKLHALHCTKKLCPRLFKNKITCSFFASFSFIAYCSSVLIQKFLRCFLSERYTVLIFGNAPAKRFLSCKNVHFFVFTLCNVLSDGVADPRRIGILYWCARQIAASFELILGYFFS